MYKIIRYLVFLIFIISSSLYAQQRKIVFNNEGRIVKNYGYDSNSELEESIDFLIENPDNNYFYYLLFNWRNEYNHSSNIIENNKLFFEKFTSDGSIEMGYPKDAKVPNLRYMNFILIKVNAKGAEKFDNKTQITLNEILTPESIILNSDNITALFPVWETLKTHKKNKETRLRTAEDIRGQNKKITQLEKQIEVKKLALNKLGMIDKASGTPDKIMELQGELNNLELALIEEQSKNSNAETEQKTEDENNDKEILKAEKRLSAALSRIQKDALAYYNLLHQGIIITKDMNVKEIVYDVHKSKLFETKRELLRVARLTPNLPQLTTDSELYCHIINLNPDDLKKNPFIISMEAELSEPVEVESPSNLRALQSVELGLSDDTFKNAKAAFASTDSIGGDIVNLETLLKNVLIRNKITLGQKEELGGYILNLKEPFQTNFLTKFGTLQDSDIEGWKQLINNVKKQYIAIEKKKLEFIEDLKKYLPKTNFTPVAYSEYILKYPKPFEAKRKPTIKLLSNQYTIENYTDKVVKGKPEGLTYDIKYGQDTLIKDELPPVHRLYRFSVNAGVILTNSVSYNYEQVPLANSSVSDLKEIKETSMDFRPSITFSTYLKRQDLAVNEPFKRWLHTTHIDVSIDYDDGDILDNIYLGVGIEPLRNIQLAFGARFGQVDRLDPNNYDPFLPISDQKFSSELDVGYYVSLSLGFDLIPKFYNLIIKK